MLHECLSFDRVCKNQVCGDAVPQNAGVTSVFASESQKLEELVTLGWWIGLGRKMAE